ncbi:hypothetical protein ACFXG8_09405, partial [Kitasatospora indigofera]
MAEDQARRPGRDRAGGVTTGRAGPSAESSRPVLLPAAAGARHPVLTRRHRARAAVPGRAAGAARRRTAGRAAA